MLEGVYHLRNLHERMIMNQSQVMSARNVSTLWHGQYSVRYKNTWNGTNEAVKGLEFKNDSSTMHTSLLFKATQGSVVLEYG